MQQMANWNNSPMNAPIGNQNQIQPLIRGRMINTFNDLGQADIPPIGSSLGIFPTSDLKTIYVKIWDNNYQIRNLKFEFAGEVNLNQNNMIQQIQIPEQQVQEQPKQSVAEDQIQVLIDKINSLEEKINNQNNKKQNYQYKKKEVETDEQSS